MLQFIVQQNHKSIMSREINKFVIHKIMSNATQPTVNILTFMYNKAVYPT